jgi:putative sterol carrier protein
MECDTMADRAENVQQVFDLMPTRLLPEQAEGVEAIIQIELTGKQGGQWYLSINDCSLTVSAGAHDNASMTMTMAANDWLEMINGEANATGLFMRGQIEIAGDIKLAMRMQTMFRFAGD